ncbi:MAG: ATP-binding protein [Candidatus Woesearchaeota archaeon]
MYIHRDLEKQITQYLKSREILAIVGPRQCGKTTLIEHILAPLDKVNTVSFDDVKTLRLFEEDVDSFIELHVRGHNFLFIDEIQYSKDSGKKLKYIYDKEKTKLVISGSSAAEMSINSLKYLVGRIFIFSLYPFSFGEFMLAKDERLAKIHAKGVYGQEISSTLSKYLQEFLVYGGYPRVVLAKNNDERKLILQSIYNTFLLKEIKEILSLSENYRLTNLMKSLSLQLGGLMNYNELSSLTGFSFLELKKHIHILEETFVCNRVKPFFSNKRIELVKIPKVYFIDTGFRNICIDNFSVERSDAGAVYENFVFSELIKKGYQPQFWRSKSGAEVDFVVKDIPIEVKSALVGEHLTKSFHSFIDKYKPKRGYILSKSFHGKKKVNSTLVDFAELVRFPSEFKV